MSVEEIISAIIVHMIKGLMIHEELANYYDFLNLKGYRMCHEYHYFAESSTYRDLCSYYINHINKLIPNIKIDVPEVIPISWYKYNRQDVDINTKRTAIKNGINMWIKWEQDTKVFYEQSFKDLIENDEIAVAMKINELITDVDDELSTAEKTGITMKSIDYNLEYIMNEQDTVCAKYKDKLTSCITL